MFLSSRLVATTDTPKILQARNTGVYVVGKSEWDLCGEEVKVHFDDPLGCVLCCFI